MTCEEVSRLLHAYADDELDLATALAVEKHLPGCAECRKKLEAVSVIRAAAAQPAVYFPARFALRDQVRRAIAAEAVEVESPSDGGIRRSRRMRSMAIFGLAAALLLIVGSLAVYFPARAPSEEITELVGSHVRSLEAEHLLDVQSTDQHTVKPWFAGKIDFSPPVIDLSADGFPLIGGRLDYLEQENVAALVYRRNKHVINLFIRPGQASPLTDSKQGFNLIRFQCKGMICWAVSDLNAAELQQFADLFQAQKAATTRF